MSRALLFTNLSQVFTSTAPDETAVLARAAVALRDGRIAALGDPTALRAAFPTADTLDAQGGVLTPGFIDSHTHAVFGGWRAGEYVMRIRGLSYMEIARRGGGILNSVRDLRSRSEDDLVELARPRLREMLEGGTTTVEIKSGYGLETESELRMLRAIQRLGREGPLEVISTFLGAHEVAPEYQGRPEDYVDLLVREMIPAVAAEKLAVFCDVFMEPGVFDGRQARRVLEAGVKYGLVPKLHADEFESSGGAELAAELAAASADHLGAISEAGVRALAASDTVATLLPATLFFLGKTAYAPARRLLDAGATVALASDYNPGTAPSNNMTLVMTLACSQMRMDPYEALHAATAGGARALRLTDGRGRIVEGAPADVVLWDVNDVAEIPYHFGRPRIRGVWKRGTRVV